jgi:hypothetical protein
MTHCFDSGARPLILAGMHRSGTSFMASLFASAGLDLGAELLAAAPSNPLGHFEDVEFLEFHCRSLASQGFGGDGFCTDSSGRVPPPLEALARDLVATRTTSGGIWGWKNPRTTLFLDFWAERLPGARYVFVFRRPWEVADSLFRRGDHAFAVDPAFAFAVWTHYNRMILEFVARHPRRCAVFAIEQLIADPDGVLAHVRNRFDVPLTCPESLFSESLFTRDDAPPRAALVRALAPEAWRTYLALLEAAGASDELVATPAAGRADAESVLLEWAWRRRTRGRPERRWRSRLVEMASASRRLFDAAATPGAMLDAAATTRPH